MNDACEEMRKKIEDSVGRDPGAAERAAIDAHCTACESCRGYRALLAADHARLESLAARLSISELRAEERAIAAIPAKAPARDDAVRAKRRGFSGLFAGDSRFAHVAAAAVILVAVAIGVDFLRGLLNGPVPAFASVIERVEGAHTLVYRDRRWKVGEWRTSEWGWNSSGTWRVGNADSVIISNRRLPAETKLVLYPSTKRAMLERWRWNTTSGNASPPKSSFVTDLASWHKRMKFSYVRRERLEGRSTAVYERVTGGLKKTTVWIDLKTELPLRMELSDVDSADSSTSYPYGLDVTDFLPRGTPRSAAAGWIDLGPGEPKVIWDDFRWNAPPDTSYFSLEPPPGYAVTKIDTVLDSEAYERMREKMRAEEISGAADAIKEALEVWVSLSGGVFPRSVEDLGDSLKVRSLLIVRHDKEGTPGDRFRAAFHDASLLETGFKVVRFYERESHIHYIGAGAVLGDSTRIVCWAEEFGIWRRLMPNPYWIIFADLRCVPSRTCPEIGKK